MANVRYKDHTLLTGGLAAGDVFPIDELVSGSTYQTRRATAAMVATYVEAGLTAIYQPLDADLTVIAALTPANDDLIQRKAGAWTNRTIAQVKTDFGLAAIATSGSASDLGAGTVPLARLAGITTAELSATAGITNSQLAGSIVYGKLTLTDSIVNADINSAAAIAYSKLNLTGAILNADLAGSIANAKLANSSITIGSTSVSLGATAATIAGLTLTAPTINGGTATALTGIGIRSTGAAFDLTIASTEVFTAGRTLTIAMGDAARTLTLGGDATLNGGTHSGTNTGDQTITLSGDVSGSGTGAITTAIGATKVTSAMLNADVYSTAHSWGGQQTFTAPILGTPASGTLTNATGLPPVTGIVGWPANASGVLTNNGSGTLTWGAGGGGSSGANPTASVGLTAVNGVATTFLRSDGAPALDQGIAPTWTAAHIFSNTIALTSTTAANNKITQGAAINIGTTSTDGIILQNTTAATVGAQQYSPRLRLTGSGWKTNATAAAQTVDWIAENQPVQGTTAPTTNLVFSNQINAGGYTPALTVASNGQVISAYTASNAPSYSFAGDTTTGWGYRSAGSVSIISSGSEVFRASGVSTFLLGNQLVFGSSADAILRYRSTANIMMGLADAASPVAQTLSVQNVVAGTSNTAGAAWTFAGSRGTGTGLGGRIAWQTAPAGSTGSTQNALVEACAIESSGTFKLKALAFSALPTAVANGEMFFCSDGAVTSVADNTLTSGGSGALAIRINGAWRAFNLQN